jgi:hypothetical protein
MSPKPLYQMRINSRDELVYDPLTRWETLIYRVRKLLGLPVRSGVVSRRTASRGSK